MSGDGEPDPQAWVIYAGDCGHRRVMNNPARVGPCPACDTKIGIESFGPKPRRSVPSHSVAVRETLQHVSSRTTAGTTGPRAGAHPIPDRPPV